MDLKKIVSFIFIACGILVYIVIRKISGDVLEYYQVFVMFEGARGLPEVIGIVFGAGSALAGIYNNKTNAFVGDVVAEIKKVTWPTRKETYAATLVVIITLLIMAAILYAFDLLWGYLIKNMIG